jgi:uncharacterized protein (TIGR02646 family)
LKKISKSPPPNPLTDFYSSNPKGNWNDFRDHSNSYDRTKEIIFKDQDGLCGYCEDYLLELDKTKRQIEHFHDKSDKDLTITNWALDWNNVFGVCKGGSDQGETHPTPRNLSCDAYKDHYLKSPYTEGVYINPLDAPYAPFFEFDKATGRLEPNIVICDTLNSYLPNNYGNFFELVEKTIEILNLNCDRLTSNRLKVLHEYNRLIGRARKTNNKDMVKNLPEHWLRNKSLPFFTVRRCLLGSQAEEYLIDNRTYPLVAI